MSYSFSIRAASKDDAGKKVEDQLTKLCESQPVHDFDRQAAQNAAEAAIEQLAAPAEGQEIVVSVSGSLGWTTGSPAPNSFTSVNLSVSASLAPEADRTGHA